MTKSSGQTLIKQSAFFSLLLHIGLFLLMWFWRADFRMVPTQSVYQVELVSVARSAPQPKTTDPPAPEPDAEPEESAVSPKLPPKKEEKPKPEEKKPVQKEPVEKQAEKKPEKPAPKPTPDPGVAAADSAVSGSNRMKIEIPDFPFAYYLNILKFRIQENWRPPPGRRERESAVVGFVISRQGKISNVVLERSSGKYHFDQAAQRAVIYANPLPPLPADFLEDYLSVHIEFEGL